MQKIVKNTVIQWLGTGLSKCIGLSVALMITRGLGAEQYGKYNLVFTFISFFNLLASFGIHTIAVRAISCRSEETRHILGDMFIMSAALSVVSGLLCIAVLQLFGYPTDVVIGVKIAALTLLLGPAMVPSVYFEANLKMFHVTISTLVRDLVLFVLTVYLSYRGAGFINYVWVSVLSTAITAVYLWLAVGRMVLPKVEINYTRLFNWFRNCLPLALSGIALYVYNYIDTIMLSKMTNMTTVGYYGVAYKFVFLGQQLPGAILVTLFPLFSKYSVTDPGRAKRYFQYAFDTIFIVALFFALMGMLYGWETIVLLFGREYVASYKPLKVFAVNCLFMFPNMLFSSYFISMGLQGKVMKFMLFTSAVNILVNIYVLPRYGALGAAFTTMLSEATFFSLSGYWLLKSKHKIINLWPAFKMLGIAAVILLLAKISKLVWWAEIVIMMGLFIGFTQWIRAYDYNKLLVLLVRKETP